MSIPEEGEKEYIGDGVYASHDGYHMWLETLEGNRIALEPPVFQSLMRYAEKFGDYFKGPSK